ncbi:hypothetical protein [Shewanella frigidimarina]|uniref:hypothetical protein n=1 Tax=Shewanella frigidimarina TaxID=56812 RepID=UPI003D7A4369
MHLRDKWLKSLSKKYGYEYEKNKEFVDESVKNLVDIYNSFVNSEQSDPKFVSQILNGKNRQYEQAMGEMLFWDVLKNNSFELLTNNGKGPDFHFTLNALDIYCEVITPEVDGKGIIEQHNQNINTRMVAGAKRTPEQDREIFLRITSALKNKDNQYKIYKLEGTIPKNAICIVVINDALLCPEDIPMLGVSHSSDWGTSPYVARATLNKNSNLKNNNDQNIPTDGFLSNELSHISAVIQATLRDDYGYAKTLVSLKNEEFCRVTGMVKDFDIVINEYAQEQLPDFIFKMNYWSLSKTGELEVQKVVSQITLEDVEQYINFIRKVFDVE